MAIGALARVHQIGRIADDEIRKPGNTLQHVAVVDVGDRDPVQLRVGSAKQQGSVVDIAQQDFRQTRKRRRRKKAARATSRSNIDRPARRKSRLPARKARYLPRKPIGVGAKEYIPLPLRWKRRMSKEEGTKR